LDLKQLMDAYDWQEAMKYAKFQFTDIVRVLEAREGERDESHWQLLVELHGGGFGTLDAWCDYTGWGCQEGGESDRYEDEATARRRLFGNQGGRA
jgi:hypothetical protein